ncbi:MAG: hypothetical protein KAG66_24595, partial [Methylococcales bacterium]|nr:hypothetical protein [Methylococcales bacterium]
KRNRLAVATRSLTTTTADCRYDSLSLVSAETPDHKVALAQCLNAFFWSPDGRHIAYIAPSIFTDIRHASHELGRARLQPRNEDTYALFVLNVASGETRNLGSFVPGAIFASQFLPFFDQYAHSHAIWSPDSATIALPVAFGPTTHIAVFHLDGQEPSIITRGSTAFWQP